MLKYISNNIFYRLILLNSIQFYFLFKLIYIFFINDKSVKLYNNICFSDNINISIILNRILLKKIIHCINNNINVFSKYYFRKINQLKYYHYNEMLTDWRGGPSGATPFRFTCKEPDPETGLYYFGARYLDPKASRWMSADPAVGEYVPIAPVNNEARGHNRNLPGMGGVFNIINLHAYHYSLNNPIRYSDPDGRAAGDEFDTMDDAAIDFAMTYNDDSIKYNREYATVIRRNENGKYTYDLPVVGAVEGEVMVDGNFQGNDIVAAIHTHGNYISPAGDWFSADDISYANRHRDRTFYLVNPSGMVHSYTPNQVSGRRGSFRSRIFTNAPNDPNSLALFQGPNAFEIYKSDPVKGWDRYYVPPQNAIIPHAIHWNRRR